MSSKCAGGYPIGDGPCRKCGATDYDTCREIDPIKHAASEQERSHFRILEDGPQRFVLCDDRSDDPAPVYASLAAAEDALDELCR